MRRRSAARTAETRLSTCIDAKEKRVFQKKKRGTEDETKRFV